MSRLLDAGPFARRDDAAFLAEMCELTRWHLDGCPAYRRIWPAWDGACAVEELPYVHVGLFKRLLLRTDNPAIEHQRMLTSSATTGRAPSRVALDQKSSKLQSASSRAILEALVGPRTRPLLVLDDARNLRCRGEVSARIAAAMSLRPLASEIVFLLDESAGTQQVNFGRLREVLDRHEEFLIYGFTSILWAAWAAVEMPADVRARLSNKKVHFVHSGGWKKLEAFRVDRDRLDAALLGGVASGSQVIDCYGLVEQVGVLFPLCEQGFRHVPRWADVVIREPWTLDPLTDQPGLLQLMNILAYGAPYHNVLTEDYGRLVKGECPCGRSGHRFELLGRVPLAEMRGCANV